MTERPTLADVATAAGVHPSTASRVLNPATRPMVRDAVARRVVEAANRLGYRPNAVAASLRRGQSLTVGVVLPDITNPVFPPILGGIEAALEAEGYAAIVVNAGDDPTRQAQIVDRLLARQVDGLILATAARHDALIGRMSVPVVLVNRTDDAGAAPYVVSDERLGMALAVRHVLALGHARIAHLGGPLSLSTGRNRTDGFLAAMKEAGLATAGIAHADSYSRAAGRAAAVRLLTVEPTAVVTANDLLALGCLDALEAAGLRCPEDVSLTGHNDMPLVDRVWPPLTTVRIPHWDMGAEAARLLLQAMAGTCAPSGEVVLRPELVVRGSTAPPATGLRA